MGKTWYTLPIRRDAGSKGDNMRSARFRSYITIVLSMSAIAIVIVAGHI